MNSALPRTVQPVASDACLSLMSGVLPIASTMPSRICMMMGPGLDRRKVEDRFHRHKAWGPPATGFPGLCFGLILDIDACPTGGRHDADATHADRRHGAAGWGGGRLRDAGGVGFSEPSCGKSCEPRPAGKFRA